MGLGAFSRGSGSCREIQSTDADHTLQKSTSCNSDSSKGSSILSISKLLQDLMAVGMNFNNKASSDQSKTSLGQSRTSVGKPSGINTALVVASNIGHGVMPKTSNASAPPGTSGTETMALLEQKGGDGSICIWYDIGCSKY
eukprot:8840990-Ditylum_brightwellii.AAC.1